MNEAYKIESVEVDSAKFKYLENKVTKFLEQFATSIYAKHVLARHVARRSLLPNHLYEDLGFKSRVEMGKFMQLHFKTLSYLKPKDTLWKKFIYDSIKEVAPACAECSDSINCFSCKT